MQYLNSLNNSKKQTSLPEQIETQKIIVSRKMLSRIRLKVDESVPIKDESRKMLFFVPTECKTVGDLKYLISKKFDHVSTDVNLYLDEYLVDPLSPIFVLHEMDEIV